MNNEVSITALMSSFGRAFHAENEDHPVFTDHLAKELMTAEEYAAVLTGTKQYVMLGAGLDTFAFREKEFLSKHRVFEDRKSTRLNSSHTQKSRMPSSA